MIDRSEWMIRTLNRIKNRLSLETAVDAAEAGRLCEGMEKIIQGIPPTEPLLSDLLRGCRLGIILLGENEKDIAPDLAASLTDALERGIRRIQGEAETPELSEALTALEGRFADEGPPVSPAEADLTINDIAAILIQIEPEDLDDFRRLGEMLKKVIPRPENSKQSRARMAEALEKMESAVTAAETAAQQTLPEALITEVGLLIEKAVHFNEDDGRAEKAVDMQKEIPGPGVGQDPDKNYMPEDADLDLIAAFITESNDLITQAEDALLILESSPDDMEAVSTVFRAFHNIKGTSAFFELNLMTELAHRAETLLSRVRDHEIRYAGGYPDLALRSIDMLKILFQNLEAALAGASFLKPDGYDALKSLLDHPEEAGISDESPEPAPSVPPEKAGVQASAENGISASAAEPEPDRNSGPDDFRKESVPPKPEPTETRKASPPSPKKASKPEPAPPAAKRSVQTVESSVRVPIERLDRFIDMVGELVVSHSMVAQDELVTGGIHHELQKKVAHTSKIVRELQNMSMSMRMIPLKTTFRKMARLVRDLSRKFGKQVTFMTEGEDTEIDRNMVDIINDPLVHMVRNALDHGIEIPEEREKAGKPRYGTVHLSAYHSAGNVVVEIADDGKGLDREMILAKARERGLVEEDATFSSRDVFSLIFEPGFSTAQIVSDVSGRGVGMDVVKKNIENIRGHIEIQSRAGQGTTFKMSLPLTLAIIDGMVVRVGREKYVIPTISIVRSVQPLQEDISTVLHRGEMLRLQGKLIPLFRISELFEIENAVTEITKAITVVVENDDQQAGLMVDELIGSQQIVIKTLGETLGNITGISGSAIMPDGKVGLIIDVGGLVRLANTGN